MLLVTLEILVVVVAPLLILYLRGPWPVRVAIPGLLAIPVLWYLTYSPVHELSHVVGTYVAGGAVTEAKLIPSFWRGEFGRAWLTTDGIHADWQLSVMTGAPYILDGVSVAVGLSLLRRGFLSRPFAFGAVFMLLCLRPAFDVVCETVAFALGDRGDFYHIAQVTGSAAAWLLTVLLMGFSAFAIVHVLRRSARDSSSAAA
jgi:hypothetical protein